MTRSLLAREVLPFLLALAALAAAALLIDAVLHLLDAVWIGRYLGIPGTLLIIGSFGYSLRKRKLITSGSPCDCCACTSAWPGPAACSSWCMPASTSTRSWPGSRCGRC